MKKTLLLSYVFMFSFLFLMASTTSFAATISVVSDTTVDVVGVYNKAGGASNFEATAFPAVVAAEPAPYSTVYTVGALNSTWDNGTGLYFQNTNPGATWIWETERAESPSTVYAPDSPLYDEDASKNGRVVKFEKKFNINGIPTGGTLHITADNAYEVWINGNQLPRPATAKVAGWENSNLREASVATSGWQTVGHLVIPAGNFVNGENTLTILAGNEYYFNDDGNNPVPAYVANPYRQMNPGALIFKLDADYTPVSPLTVVKTANTSYDREWDWTIVKSADQTDLDITSGQEFDVDYTVTVTPSSEDINHAVSGTITITNPSGNPDVTVTSIIDTLDLSGDVTLSCDQELPAILSALEVINCTYNESVTDKSDGFNTVEVETDIPVADNSDTAEVTWGSSPTNLIDECIVVDDTNSEGPQEIVVCHDDPINEKTFQYTVTLGDTENSDISLECGENDVPNTASFETQDDPNDTTESGSDNWNVHVTITDCFQGCTLTQGYWKTHNDSFKGGAPTDDNWDNIGPSAELTGFFTTLNFYPVAGPNVPPFTWFTVFQTAPKGNAYYNLAHQYMAAKLNVLNGAVVPGSVSSAITAAEDFFHTYTPTAFNNLGKKHALRTQVVGWAGTLGSFNEGAIGPGHCDEQNP